MHQVLYKFGFGFVREKQGVQNPESQFQQVSLIAIVRTGMSTSAIVPDLLHLYRMLKISIFLEPYFTSVTNTFWDVLIRRELGHPTYVLTKWDMLHTRQVIRCSCYVTRRTKIKCISLFYCKFLYDLRQKYIPRKHTVQLSYGTLRRMMQDQSCPHDLDSSTVKINVAKYDHAHNTFLFLERKFKSWMWWSRMCVISIVHFRPSFDQSWGVRNLFCQLCAFDKMW